MSQEITEPCFGSALQRFLSKSSYFLLFYRFTFIIRLSRDKMWVKGSASLVGWHSCSSINELRWWACGVKHNLGTSKLGWPKLSSYSLISQFHTKQPWTLLRSCGRLLKWKLLRTTMKGTATTGLCFLTVTKVWNITQKWRLSRTVEVKLRCWRPTELSQGTASTLVRNTEPEGELADSRVVVHCAVILAQTRLSWMSKSKKTLPVLFTKSNVRSVQQSSSTRLMHFGNKSSNEVEIIYMATRYI